jgi:hypothetical protein
MQLIKILNSVSVMVHPATAHLSLDKMTIASGSQIRGRIWMCAGYFLMLLKTISRPTGLVTISVL